MAKWWDSKCHKKLKCHIFAHWLIISYHALGKWKIFLLCGPWWWWPLTDEDKLILSLLICQKMIHFPFDQSQLRKTNKTYGWCCCVIEHWVGKKGWWRRCWPMLLKMMMIMWKMRNIIRTKHCLLMRRISPLMQTINRSTYNAIRSRR